MRDFAETMTPLAQLAIGYAGMVTADIPADRFGRRPEGVETSPPAWCLGHLSIYPDRCLEMLGRPELAASDPRFDELFKNGAPSPDDPDGSYYPSKDEIMARYADRHAALLAVLPDLAPEAFAAENPNEKMRERFPTVGHLTGFLLTGHAMMHLGQVSTWRRCMGLGPCM